MAQPNVAREPSMDEILASIRKIIESNEPGLPAFPANDIGSASSFRPSVIEDEDAHIDDIHLTIDDEALAAEFEAEEQRLMAETVLRGSVAPAPAPLEALAVTENMAPPQSLADVAARVRAASERNSLALRAEASDLNARSIAENPLLNRETPVEQKIAEPEVQSFENNFAAAEAPAPTSLPSAEAVSIVSPAVGAQVARSFDDLAQALDAGPRRSFDEIAQDMLRPMLQEWLDDNLPTLVERLVREEIERVARGPRRG